MFNNQELQDIEDVLYIAKEEAFKINDNQETFNRLKVLLKKVEKELNK